MGGETLDDDLGFYYGDATVRDRPLTFGTCCASSTTTSTSAGFHWTLTAAPPPCHRTHHNYLALSAATRSLAFCQQVASSLSGTGLFFLRCQNRTIHSHRVTSHPAHQPTEWGRRRFGPPRISNLTLPAFIFFFLHFSGFLTLWSILQHPGVPRVGGPKAPTFSSVKRWQKKINHYRHCSAHGFQLLPATNHSTVLYCGHATRPRTMTHPG